MSRGPVRVLVTGSSGHLGTALRRRIDADAGLLPLYLLSPRVPAASKSERSIDIRDETSLREAFASTHPQAVIHLASVVGATCDLDPELAQAVNVDAVRTLTQLSREFGASRFLFASSAAVYGDEVDVHLSEDAPLRPRSNYARTKADAERVLSTSDGLETISLRIFNMFGSGDKSSLIWRLQNAQTHAPVMLKGPDDFVRDYVHVEDVVDAIVASIDAPLSRVHETVNIASGIRTTNSDLIRAFRSQAGLHYEIRGGKSSYSYADVSQALQLLKFDPKRSIVPPALKEP
jgi:UDP-glucose 4-epimerase